MDGEDALGAEQVGALLLQQPAQPSIEAPPIALALHLKCDRGHALVVLVLPILLPSIMAVTWSITIHLGILY